MPFPDCSSGEPSPLSPLPPTMMTVFRSLEAKLQRLDGRLASLTADSTESSARLFERLDSIAAGLGVSGAADTSVHRSLQGAFSPSSSQKHLAMPLPGGDHLTIDEPPVEERAGNAGHKELKPEANHHSAEQQEEGQNKHQVRREFEVVPEQNDSHHVSVMAFLEENSKLSAKTQSRVQSVEIVAIITIALNTIGVMLELQYSGHNAGVNLGLSEAAAWPDLDPFFNALEHIFNVVFIGELVFRVWVYRTEFFFSPTLGLMKFNIFDTFLIMATSIDLYILRIVGVGGEGAKLTSLRSVRFFRFPRMLRVFGALQFFSPLRNMMAMIAASISAMFWAMFMLLIVLLMAAIMACESVQSLLVPGGEGLSPDTLDWVFHNYGTTSNAIWTFIRLTFSGGWPNYVHRLVIDVSSWYAVPFFFYVFAVIFALFRIVTALLVQDTMVQASKDAELAVQKKQEQKEHILQQLLDFFVAADLSGDGLLTVDEFHHILHNEKVRMWLDTIGLSINESNKFFDMLAGADGIVSFQEFTDGIRTMKGPARSEDLMILRVDTERSHKAAMHEFATLRTAFEEIIGSLQVRSFRHAAPPSSSKNK